MLVMQNNLNRCMELRFSMPLSIKKLKRLILCTYKITDNEIKEYYNLFHEVNLDILIDYISLLKIYLLLARMYILGLDINKILKKYDLKCPFDFLNLDYVECDDFELEYIVNFYNFIIMNIRKVNTIKILSKLVDIRDKYNDIIILMKAKNGGCLSTIEFDRLVYLKNIFKEWRISYIIKKEEYIKLFNNIPDAEEIYQEIDESTNDRYLIWNDYRSKKVYE